MAVLKVLGDILRAVDSGDLVVLMLLDLSAAFDNVDHATLFRCLGGDVINWFTSYLNSRTQSVRCSQNNSKTLPLLFGICQVSVLG